MTKTFNLKNNQIFVLAEAAGGVYNSAQLRLIVEIAERESAFVKITEESLMGFMIDAEKILEITTQLQAHGLLLRHYKSNSIPYVRSCLGELCPHSEQNALDDCLDLSAKLSSHYTSLQQFVSIGINGCSRSCLGSATNDIHIVAESTGYKMSIGGKSTELPQLGQFFAENIQKGELPTVMIGVLDLFFAQRQNDESFPEVIERLGMTPFLELIGSSELEAESGLEADSESEISNSEQPNASDILTDSLNDEFENFDPELDSATKEISEHEANESAFEDIPLADEISPEEISECASMEADSALKSQENSFMADENIELEEGTPKDLERVTRAIRSEVEADSAISLVGNLENEEDLDSDLMGEEESDVVIPLVPFPQELRQVAAAAKGRLRIKNIGTELCVTLPSGVECRVPIQNIEPGSSYDVELSDGILTLECEKNSILIRYGGFCISVPLTAEKKAA